MPLTTLCLLLSLSASALAQEPALDPDSEPSVESAEPKRAPADLLLQERLQLIFSQIEPLAEVEIGVTAGVVRLEGALDSPADRDIALAVVGKMSGVVWVDDRLQVQAPPESPVTAPDVALQRRLAGLFAEVETLSEIQVEVRNSVVRLRGEVPSYDDQKAAVALAERTSGVAFVDDGTVVATSVEKRVQPAVKALQTRARDLVSRMPLFGIGLVLLLVFWFGSRWISAILFHRRWTGDRPLLVGLAQQSVRVGIFLAGLILVLDLLDLTTIVGAMLGTAGILGVALGFAFRDIVENYLASIILTVRQPFARGDTISVAGNQGRVLRLTLRETVLVTADGNHLRVPNATIFKSVLQNFSTNPLRRFRLTFNIDATNDLSKAIPVLRRVLLETEGVLPEPAPSVTVEELGDRTVGLAVAAWVNQREASFGGVRTRVLKRIKAALEQSGIERPESTLRVLSGPRQDAPVLSVDDSEVGADSSEEAEPFLVDREDGSERNLLR